MSIAPPVRSRSGQSGSGRPDSFAQIVRIVPAAPGEVRAWQSRAGPAHPTARIAERRCIPLISSATDEIHLSHTRRSMSVSVVHRSRNKKYCKERQGRTGVKVKVGSHLDGPAAQQCPRCDRGKHRRCLHLKHCTAQVRSPPGVVKREQGACARTRTCESASFLP